MEKMDKTLPPKYDPKTVEKGRYNWWLEGEFFKATNEVEKQTYTIVIPPPNVTGKLHLGHAWDTTLQDILTRFKRMQGYNTLYLPGMDHAGISTQAKVEEKLREEGITRYHLGREKFLEKTWEWKEEYAGYIREQWGKMGLGLDYSRERFTLDEGLSKAVREVFVKLYEKDLIYRGQYIINWDPATRTALSDIEVIHKEVQGAFYHLEYPLTDGTGKLRVATTRPETMLGDTGIAVNPKDERYTHLIGKTVTLPIMNREIPVIADEYVDMEFGTGVVKITPAHDPNDFEIGNRHNLPRELVMNEDGTMNKNAGKYEGMDRFECRKQIVKDLQEQGVLVEIEEHTHSVGHSERSGAVVEPYLSTQWFVKMEPLAKASIELQQLEGKVNFVPNRFEHTYLQWMENIHDWCISRQLWWGHRIPAWYDAEGNIYVANTFEEVEQQFLAFRNALADDAFEEKEANGTTEIYDRLKKLDEVGLKQDEDVLDTWFSSALWPFSTLGWPNTDHEDFQRFYPTNTLITGYDIIFFWVSRMIFTAIEFTDQRPFQDVLIHGLIRDEQGRKMSKSLGNGVDPMDVIDKYGADSLRYFLATAGSPGQDVRFSFEKVEATWNFVNKIWNASRFALMNMEGFTREDIDLTGEKSVADKWILTRLNETISSVTKLMDKFEFGEVGRVLYNFIWDDFCDWYIEMAKIPLYSEKESEKKTTRSVLAYVLENTMKMLHPFMPFVTEEIWQALPIKKKSITVAKWPTVRPELSDEAAAGEMKLLVDIIRSVRNIRAEVNTPMSKKVDLMINGKDAEIQEKLARNVSYIERFCNPENLTITTGMEAPEKSMSAIVTGAEIYLPLADLINVEEELARLKKELEKYDKEVERVQKKLANQGFVAKAPKSVIEGEQAKEQDYLEKREAVRQRILDLQE